MAEFLLKVVSLNKRYNKKIIALYDVNLILRKGCILGILGPNGAGKSTLIHILANMVKRDSGEIYIFDQKIEDNSYQYKSRCGFVFEQPFFIRKFSIQEYFRFAAILYDMKPCLISKRIEELLDFFELREKQFEWIERCSKGLQKRVSIATCLIHKPELLILDEPLADLDVIMTKKMRELFKQLRNKGIAILFVSHNISDLADICDEICIFKSGTVIYRYEENDIVDSHFNKTYKSNHNLEELFFKYFKERVHVDIKKW